MDESAAAWRAVRARQVIAMRLSLKTLGHIALGLNDEKARSLRDGADGWSILEIVCHLRDFDEIFYQRAQMMLAQDHPQLPAYDHEAMAIERNYQADSLAQAYSALQTSRARFVDFFKGLTEASWARGGIHPERDSFSMTDAAMQVPLHDLDHIEQITRVLSRS
ncbi:MAG: DinB family protein [Chloroflexi bacterium]|nr:DinB family protein [Chloroflexota bacterium]MCY4246715.1 DinB family protein [Chloroflexota bacterium]